MPAAGTQQRVAPRVGGPEIEHIYVAVDARISPPAVPQRRVAQLHVLTADPPPLQLGRAGAVDRDRGGELGEELVRRLEPLRAGVLRAQSDRPCALSRVGECPWAAPGLKRVRNDDVDVLVVERRRELVEDEVDGVPRCHGLRRDGREQLGHEVTAPAGAHEAETHVSAARLVAVELDRSLTSSAVSMPADIPRALASAEFVRRARTSSRVTPLSRSLTALAPYSGSGVRPTVHWYAACVNSRSGSSQARRSCTGAQAPSRWRNRSSASAGTPRVRASAEQSRPSSRSWRECPA